MSPSRAPEKTQPRDTAKQDTLHVCLCNVCVQIILSRLHTYKIICILSVTRNTSSVTVSGVPPTPYLPCCSGGGRVPYPVSGPVGGAVPYPVSGAVGGPLSSLRYMGGRGSPSLRSGGGSPRLVPGIGGGGGGIQSQI